MVIETDLVNNPTPTADEPDDTKESGEIHPKNQGAKKKTFITKEYGVEETSKEQAQV